MLFNKLKEMHSKYACSKGFAIVIASTTKGRDGIVQFIMYGFHKLRHWVGRSSRSSNVLYTIRTQCMACIKGSRAANGRWKVNTVCDDHNHKLDA